MNTRRVRDLGLAVIGLGALSAAILACTSFSPDDKQVLYPAYDSSSGTLGMALYDREARRSDMFFLPIVYQNATNSEVASSYIRGRWLPNGRSVLFCWTGGEGTEDKSLDLALMPWGGKPSVKLFHVPVLKDAAAQLLYPLCVAGDSVLFMLDSREVVRLDLNTGALVHHTFDGGDRDITLMPAPDGDGAFYFEKDTVFGRLDAQSFSRTPLMTITNSPSENSFFAYDREGKLAAFVEGSAATNRLVVLRQSRTVFTRPLSALGELAFGNAILSPKGDRLWATYEDLSGTNTVSYGLMEIPFSDAPVRKITLIAAAPPDKDKNAASYFQFGMSHDGKTAAVASTYLAAGDKLLRAEDCALFLVDLHDPNRKVTKVPLASPPTAPHKQ